MPQWIETAYFYQLFEEDYQLDGSENKTWAKGVWNWHYWRPKKESLTRVLGELIEHCTKHQYTIKATFPLTRAQAHDFAQGEFWKFGLPTTSSVGGYGMGYGWGISNIIGVAVLLQRTIEVSQEDYDARLGALQAKDRVAELEPKLKELNKQIEEAKADIAKADGDLKKAETESRATVETKKSMFGLKFVVGEKDFGSAEKAAAYQQTRAADAQGLASHKAQLTGDLTRLQKQATDLNAELAALKQRIR